MACAVWLPLSETLIHVQVRNAGQHKGSTAGYIRLGGLHGDGSK